ncbi:hypothetical protein [Burkholderia gladioli]|uniref:hypothetical protein n=1 Tax=Burkholderia gladioli TaxID=28095 RepID=UPI003EDFD94C
MIEMLQAVSGLKTAIELARTALAARDDAKITNAIRDMNDRLFDVQQASMLVQEKNQDLIQRNATLQEANLSCSERLSSLKSALKTGSGTSFTPRRAAAL